MIHRFWGIPFAAGLAMIFAAAAMAAAGWSQPQELSAPQTIPNSPEVAANAKDAAVAIWYQFADQGREAFVRAAVRHRGARFSSPVTLGPAKLTIGGNLPSFANGAVDGRGDMAVTWLEKDSQAPGKLRVVVAYKPSKGHFGAPHTISPGEFDSFQPQIAVNKRGEFVVVWQRFDKDLFQVQAAIQDKGQAGFGAPITLSSPKIDSQFPRVGVTADGRAVVAWRAKARDHSGAHSFVQAVSLSPAGRLGTLQALSDSQLDAGRPKLATAPSGKTMVVWSETNGTTLTRVAGAFSSSDGDFGGEQALTPLDAHGGIDPRVGLDARGAATILWLEEPLPGKTGDDFIRFATATPNGKLGSPHELSRAGHLLTPVVAVAPGGATAAVWVQTGGNHASVLSAIRPARERHFSPTGAVAPASTSADSPALTASARTTTAAWVGHGTDGYSVETSHRSLK